MRGKWMGWAAGLFGGGLLLGLMLGMVGARNGVVEAAQDGVMMATPTQLAVDAYQLIDAYDAIITNLYDRVSASVVHITSRQTVSSFFYGMIPQEGTGSGFVYDAEGHIVTNNHVIEGAEELDVLLVNGMTLAATVVGTDPYYDLAVVKVDLPAGMVTPLELGDSSLLKVGQTVIAIGNPFGLDRTLTSGVISALGRRIETDQGTAIGQAIQTDAAINPGNSGGPLLDIRGRVLGINTAINSPSGGSVGIGFAVPANIIRQVVPSLINDGRYAHPSLGAQLAELGTEIRPGSNTVQRGLLVVQLEPGGAGERSGLQPAEVQIRRGRYVFSGGDIITAVGGVEVATRNDLLLALEENYRPGDTVEVTLVRDGQTLTIPVILGAA